MEMGSGNGNGIDCRPTFVSCEVTVRAAALGADREKSPLYPPWVNLCLHTTPAFTQ